MFSYFPIPRSSRSNSALERITMFRGKFVNGLKRSLRTVSAGEFIRRFLVRVFLDVRPTFAGWKATYM